MSLQKYLTELNAHLKRVYFILKISIKFNLNKLNFKKIKFSWRLWYEFITEDDFRKEDFKKFDKKYPFVMSSINYITTKLISSNNLF